jgi:hypothetical protein
MSLIAQKRAPKIGYLSSWGTAVVLKWPSGSPAPGPPEGPLKYHFNTPRAQIPYLGYPFLKGIPKWFFGQVVLGRPGVPRPNKNIPVQQTNGFFAWPPSAARPKNHVVLENVWFVDLCTPGLLKPPDQKKNFGIPLSTVHTRHRGETGSCQT